MMGQQNEVFNISLTELAFTLVLLLVMLLGTRLFMANQEAQEQQRVIVEQKKQINDQKLFIEKLTELGYCKPDPEDPISPMMPCNKCLSVVANITKKQAANAISLGTELMKVLEESKEEFSDISKKLLDAASIVAQGKNIASKEELTEAEEKLSISEKALLEAQTELKNIKLALNEDNQEKITLAQCKSENSHLQEQVKLVDIRNKYLAKKAGFGYPPCWISSAGKPQYIFGVDLLPDDKVVINKAWPNDREAEAEGMEPVQNVKPLLGKTIPINNFLPYAEEILRISNNTKPSACRHYVKLRNHIPDRATGDKQRLRIEAYFYKLELPN